MSETLLSEAEVASSSTFPGWTFKVPLDVVQKGFQIAIYGQDVSSGNWVYWDDTTGAYKPFSSGASRQDKNPLITVPAPKAHSGQKAATFAVGLPTGVQINSGVVAMFIGGSSGIPVTGGQPASPTAGTNPDDMFAIFEFTYAVPTTGGDPILDIDISNIDQMGFTYAVTSTGDVPFPMSKVGSTVGQSTLFSRFADAFPEGDPFNQCLAYGQSADGTQIRLVAPQDVLQAVLPPAPPSYLAPSGAPGATDPFASDHTYFYMVSETTDAGETAPSNSVFGGFLLTDKGHPAASQIDIGWQSGGDPVAYTPVNPAATGLRVYRASTPPVDAGGSVPSAPPPGPDYELVTSMSIADWNAQANHVYPDSATTLQDRTPRTSSYGFSALSTWFDQPLRDFFGYYLTNAFQLFQNNQSGGSSAGTQWTGRVKLVRPNAGEAITDDTYIDANGDAKPVSATWQWGDGTQAYLALQLIGNAYDSGDLSKTTVANTPGKPKQTDLTAAEYEGAVLNVYFPYFTGNTGLASVSVPATLDLPVTNVPLPAAPGWMNNSVNDPGQMVFGCAGVFATPNDPDAVSQNMPVLAANALTNIQNVIVSALNRGLATGYGMSMSPQQYTCLYAFSEAPQSTAKTGAIPGGTYTYYLSGVLNNGDETALSWSQTITFPADAEVTLTWLAQSPALYKQANVYRQKGTGPIALVGTVANTTSAQATGFTDSNVAVPQPTNGAPFAFYPGWTDRSGADFVPSNLYSAFLHQNANADPANGISINGLAYGYPFDDQGGFSTNINYGTSFPTGVTFEISTLS